MHGDLGIFLREEESFLIQGLLNQFYIPFIFKKTIK